MKNVKFEYIYKKMGKSKLEKVKLTLKQIEKGTPFSGFGALIFEIIARRQFTGLKDKNGVEIYEGDIVSYLYYSDETPELFTVIFEAPRFCFNSHNDNKNWNIRDYDLFRLEVIGNIYENKELLDEK